MTATYKTKRQILKLFINGIPLTLTDISNQLGLAASTVSQHINELRNLGAIQEVDRQGTKKWKYYKLNHEKAQELYVKWSGKETVRWVNEGQVASSRLNVNDLLTTTSVKSEPVSESVEEK